MAQINLDVEKIVSINNELDSLNKTLIGSYTPELKDTISAIRNNVASTQMHSILNTIVAQVDSITNDISAQLPKLQGFLETQMKSYQMTEAEAEANLEAVLQKMQSFSGITTTAQAGGYSQGATTSGTASTEGSAAASTGSTASSTGEDGSASDYEHGWGEKYAETWSSWWGDVQEAYSDTHGLFSGIGNTAEALLDTAGALVETVGNGLSDAAHAVGNIIGWIFG